MEFSLITEFKNGRQDVQRLNAVDKSDAREHVRDLVHQNQNVKSATVRPLVGADDEWFFTAGRS